MMGARLQALLTLHLHRPRPDFLLLLQVAIAVMHMGRLYLFSGWLSVLVAFQCVLLWFRLNYFSRWCHSQGKLPSHVAFTCPICCADQHEQSPRQSFCNIKVDPDICCGFCQVVITVS